MDTLTLFSLKVPPSPLQFGWPNSISNSRLALASSPRAKVILKVCGAIGSDRQPGEARTFIWVRHFAVGKKWVDGPKLVVPWCFLRSKGNQTKTANHFEVPCLETNPSIHPSCAQEMENRTGNAENCEAISTDSEPTHKRNHARHCMGMYEPLLGLTPTPKKTAELCFTFFC